MGGIKFMVGLPSELMDGATPEMDDAKFLPVPVPVPDVEDMESRDDSIDGNGSRSLSRAR